MEESALPKFEQFIKERQYLHNVSPATVSWYTHNFKWMPSESPTEDELKAMVIRMREKGPSPCFDEDGVWNHRG